MWYVDLYYYTDYTERKLAFNQFSRAFMNPFGHFHNHVHSGPTSYSDVNYIDVNEDVKNTDVTSLPWEQHFKSKVTYVAFPRIFGHRKTGKSGSRIFFAFCALSMQN